MYFFNLYDHNDGVGVDQAAVVAVIVCDGVLKVLCDGSPGMAPTHVLVPFQVIPCYLETNDNSGAPMHFYLRERDVHHGFQRCDLLICVGVTMTIDGCERISQVRIRLHD